MSDVTLLADVFPAAVNPLPDGVPAGAKIRVIIATDRWVIAWSGGKNGTETIIHTVEMPLTEEESSRATYLGGVVAGKYTVSRGPGCSCGSAGLKNWTPWPESQLTVLHRTPASLQPSDGVTRYSRA